MASGKSIQNGHPRNVASAQCLRHAYLSPFYCEILGFEMVGHSPFYAEGEFHWAMLRFGDLELMLNTAYDEDERPSQPDADRIASHCEVVFYLGCPDVDFAYRHLVAHALEVEPPKWVRYGGVHPWYVLSVFDPDGYHLCFQWPIPEPNEAG